MAEAIVAVGLLGTAVQLAEVVIKAGKGTRDIVKDRSEILKTCAYIQHLVAALECILPDIREDIETATIPDEHKSSLMQLMRDCSSISDRIREIIERGTCKTDFKPWQRYLQAYRLLSGDTKVQKLVDHLSKCLSALQCFHNVYHTKVQTMAMRRLLELSQPPPDSNVVSNNTSVAAIPSQSASLAGVISTAPLEQQTIAGYQSGDTPSRIDNLPTIEQSYRTMCRRVNNTAIRKCTCTRSTLSYAWPRSLRLTGWVAHENSCPIRCQQTGISIWLASVFLATAIKLDLDIAVSSYQGFSIRCNLTPISVVPCVSPGFILAKKLSYSPWDWHSQRNTIVTMLETGAMTFDQVDPSGRGWLEVCFEHAKNCSVSDE